jgi:hypothetical protein
MTVTGLKMGHFFVWSPKGSLQTIVNFDPMFWVHLQEKLSTLFKAYIVPYLLSAKQLCICPKCEKVCCEPDEINIPLENSVLCVTVVTCGTTGSVLEFLPTIGIGNYA